MLVRENTRVREAKRVRESETGNGQKANVCDDDEENDDGDDDDDGLTYHRTAQAVPAGETPALPTGHRFFNFEHTYTHTQARREVRFRQDEWIFRLHNGWPFFNHRNCQNFL